MRREETPPSPTLFINQSAAILWISEGVHLVLRNSILNTLFILVVAQKEDLSAGFPALISGWRDAKAITKMMKVRGIHYDPKTHKKYLSDTMQAVNAIHRGLIEEKRQGTKMYRLTLPISVAGDHPTLPLFG